MIKRVKIEGLHRKFNYDLDFHDDLTLLTGRNGSGKTAVVKLAWYLFSGNIERTVKEVNFDYIEVVSDKCTVAVRCHGEDPSSLITITARFDGTKVSMQADIKREEWISRGGEIDVLNSQVAAANGSSRFFPTFRRVEGGFSSTMDLSLAKRSRSTHELTQALVEYSESISVFDHHFVAALSTHDIQQLLTSRFAVASRNADAAHLKLYKRMKEIIEKITVEGEERQVAPGTYKKVLKELRTMVESAEKKRAEFLEKFTKLEEIVKPIFIHKGIGLSNSVIFGDRRDPVPAEFLSAGEKQLLSFLCYNAFLTNAVIIIDEPEISLHPDWQRRLIPLLLSQNSKNQFIMTTHSPFIYAKFPEHELCLSNDKGE